MDLSVFLVADYANVEIQGKLNVMGIFKQINSFGFPMVQPEMYLVMKFSVSPAEYGQTRKIIVRLMDEDGGQMFEWGGDFKIPDKPPDPGRHDVNHIFRLTNTRFPKPGTYQFSVLIDKDEKGSYAVNLNKIEVKPKIEG